MTPRQLAQRIAALDWSMLPLQHLLAVTAAVETLCALPSTETNVVPFLPLAHAHEPVTTVADDGSIIR
jgi:hypothetical protein